MKKIILIAFFLAWAQAILFAGELREEVDSYEEAFHHAIHNAPEIYLICYYQIDKKPWGKEWEQLEIKATIVDVVKGERKVGDKIEFVRVLDGKYGDISMLSGSLHYVQYYRVEEKDAPEFGKLSIDAQDPFALFRYSPEFSVLASKHKNKAQQDGGGQSATRLESK